MNNEITWTVTEPNGTVTSTKKKMSFVNPIKIVDTMDDSQKNFFNTYNNMQKELVKNGLMESK